MIRVAPSPESTRISSYGRYRRGRVGLLVAKWGNALIPTGAPYGLASWTMRHNPYGRSTVTLGDFLWAVRSKS